MRVGKAIVVGNVTLDLPSRPERLRTTNGCPMCAAKEKCAARESSEDFYDALVELVGAASAVDGARLETPSLDVNVVGLRRALRRAHEVLRLVPALR